MTLRTGGPLLSLQGLRTRLDTPAGPLYPVDSVSFDVFAGETVGLVGESGSGKSMVARSILRIVPEPGDVCAGKIIFDGEDLAQYTQAQMQRVRGKRIGVVFQDAPTYLNPVMSVGNQIREALALHTPGRATTERIEELLRLVELPDPRDAARRYPHELSGGMCQRVMIAMALACDPELVIADEPTTALDVTIQAQILELLQSLQERLGLAVLLISHDLGVIAQVCQRVCVMYAGRVCEASPMEDFFSSPRHPYSAGLLQSALSLDDAAEELYSIGGSVPDLTSPPSGCRFHPRCRWADDDTCLNTAPALEGATDAWQVACHHPLGPVDEPPTDS